MQPSRLVHATQATRRHLGGAEGGVRSSDLGRVEEGKEECAVGDEGDTTTAGAVCDAFCDAVCDS